MEADDTLKVAMDITNAMDVVRYKAFDGDIFKCEMAQDDALRLARKTKSLEPATIEALYDLLSDEHSNAPVFALIILHNVGEATPRLRTELASSLLHSSVRVRQISLRIVARLNLESDAIKASLLQIIGNRKEECLLRLKAFALLAKWSNGYLETWSIFCRRPKK